MRLVLPMLFLSVVGGAFSETPPISLSDLKSVQAEVSRQQARCAVAVVMVESSNQFGSGVLLADRIIVTAAHVIGSPGSKHEVYLSDGRKMKAEALGKNEATDLGLMRVSELDATKIKDRAVAMRSLREPPKLGEWVFTLGNPGEFDKDRGPVLRVGRIVRVMSDTIQTDCIVMGGDSGGPVFDMKGRLVAITSRMSNTSDQNFHATTAGLQRDWKELIAKQELNRPSCVPWVGAKLGNSPDGLKVEAIATGGPAETAGVKQGDLLLSIGGESAPDYSTFLELLPLYRIGETMKWTLSRDGREKVVEVSGGRR